MNRFVVSLALLMCLGSRVGAEEPPAPTRFYRLDFVMQEVDGTKIIDSRQYSATAATGVAIGCSIRTGSQVNAPVANQPNFTQSYNVGVNIDAARLREANGSLSLTIDAQVETISQEGVPGLSSGGVPVIRKDKWSSTLLIPLKKPTIIFSSDDLTSKHKMQLVLTATPLQ